MRRTWMADEAQTMGEYAVVLGAVALTVAGAVFVLGPLVQGGFQALIDSFP
jgi:Flp pilus assembly pilin Flp